VGEGEIIMIDAMIDGFIKSLIFIIPISIWVVWIWFKEISRR
jgi:hypothetical protein